MVLLMESVGLNEVRAGHAKPRGLFIHHFRKAGFAAANMLGNGLCGVVAGKHHHAVQHVYKWHFLVAGKVAGGAARFNVAARVHYLVYVRRVFNSQYAGHYLCGAGGVCLRLAVLFIKHGARRRIHKADIGRGYALRVKFVRCGANGQHAEREYKYKHKRDNSFQIQIGPFLKTSISICRHSTLWLL